MKLERRGNFELFKPHLSGEVLMVNNQAKNNLIITSLFGTLWGIIELTLGTLLHSSKIPFSGTILAFFAILIIVISRSFLNYKGSTIAISSVAAVLKLLIIPGFNITPFLAIIFEGLIGETVFFILPYNLFTAIITGSLLLLYTLIHGLIMQGVFFGFSIYNLYIDMINSLGRTINYKNQFALILIPFIISIYILLGSFAGFLGWRIANRTKEILQEKSI